MIKKNISLFSPIFIFITIIWSIKLIEILFNTSYAYSLGLEPRSISSLVNIFTTPLVHSNLSHLISNTLPLIVFSIIILINEKKMKYTEILFFIVIFGGFFLWLFGRNAIHVGASGVIFGLFGYLIAAAIFRKKIFDIFVAIILIFFYWSIIYGILPNDNGVSWEGHLFGLVSGVLSSFIFNKADNYIYLKNKNR